MTELFPQVRQRVLAVLYGSPARSFYSSEVIALAQSDPTDVQRELVALEEASLLTINAIGSRKHYQANTSMRVYEDLRGLVMVDVLRSTFAFAQARIDAAFVFGSLTKEGDTAATNINLLICSDTLSYSEIFVAIEDPTALLCRRLNPTLFSRDELRERIGQSKEFAARVLVEPKVWVIGSDEVLSEFDVTDEGFHGPKKPVKRGLDEDDVGMF